MLRLLIILLLVLIIFSIHSSQKNNDKLVELENRMREREIIQDNIMKTYVTSKLSEFTTFPSSTV
jgi:uncharacterized membrane protein